MLYLSHSTLKAVENISEASSYKLKEKVMKMISAIAQFYFACPENASHIRHFVDPITGRAIPVQTTKKS